VNARSSLVTDDFASGHLRALDLATRTAEPGRLAQSSSRTAPRRWCSTLRRQRRRGTPRELRWQGAFVQDGSSDGCCGRVKRLVFAR
jgi:hypothetical protein